MIILIMISKNSQFNDQKVTENKIFLTLLLRIHKASKANEVRIVKTILFFCLFSALLNFIRKC